MQKKKKKKNHIFHDFVLNNLVALGSDFSMRMVTRINE